MSTDEEDKHCQYNQNLANFKGHTTKKQKKCITSAQISTLLLDTQHLQ